MKYVELVSNDKYELPYVVAVSFAELERMTGIKTDTLQKACKRKNVLMFGGKQVKIICFEVADEYDDV